MAVNEGASLGDCQSEVVEFLFHALVRQNFLNTKMKEIPVQPALLVFCFRPSLPPETVQEQVCCVFVIHPCDILIRALGGVMTKLSIACCNQDISRCTWRKEFLQLQVNIICIVEEEQPVSIALVRKPTQTPIYRLLNIIRSDSRTRSISSVCSIGSINVEDIREAEKPQS
jgi:hypothetical protein